MSLPYFYEPGAALNAACTLSEETSKHCVQVLRMKRGEQLHLTDGRGHLFTATIIEADKKAAVARIEDAVYTAPPSRRASIAISLLKNSSRFEWFLEKATEIGISGIYPLRCSRTERQQFRHDRMNNILVSAMLQSQQRWLPLLHEPKSVEELLAIEKPQRFIAFCEEHDKKELKQFDIGADVIMLIGPEGDFTPEEISSALASGYQPVSLGNTRLRSETAGVVAATLLMNL